MSKIKSALEIALEKTNDIKIDKKSLLKKEYRDKGKKLASDYMDSPDISLKEELSKFTNEEKQYVREGIISTLLTNITLPPNEMYVDNYDTIEKGLLMLEDIPQTRGIFKQFKPFMTKYLSDMNSLEEQLAQQYKPKLMEKQQALSKQLGRNIEIDPRSDPEFMKILGQNMERLQSHYGQLIDEIKQQLANYYVPG